MNLRKEYPGVVAVDGVSLDVAAGTTHALVGENGAGKSTLIKMLAGAVAPDGGHVELDGREVTIRDAADGIARGIAVVYQELQLVDDLTVSENVFLGRWPSRGRGGLIDFAELHARAEELLASLDVDLPVRRPVHELSVAQQQVVEIARALSLEARLLVLDEPSAVLTPHELRSLFRLVRDLCARGVGVIYISHRLDEIFELADEVTVLRDGRHVSTRAIGDVDRSRLIVDMVGRPLEDEFPPRDVELGGEVLRVDDLSADGSFADVSFSVRAGEVFALTGLVGSGRSSVLRTIFGARRASAGAVSVGETTGPFRNPREAIAAGVGSLPEDRKLQGLLLQRSVRENVVLANLSARATAGLVSPRRERDAAEAHVKDLRIRTPDTEVAVASLSGGNQQKALVARWLDRDEHRVLLFDEPTRGVDVGAKRDLYLLLNSLAAKGVAIVMVSSELPEVVGMADRIGVMHEGRLAGIVDNSRRDATQEELLRLAAGEERAA